MPSVEIVVEINHQRQKALLSVIPFDREILVREARAHAAAVAAIGRRVDRARRAFGAAAARLDALSPLAVLGRGYALARREADGRIVRSTGDVTIGDRLRLQLASGRLGVDVTDLEPASDASPTDPAAEKHTYTRDQAKSDGGFRCLLPPKAETAFVTVYAVINREGAWHYSEGKTARVAARGRCRVRYRAGPEKRLGFFSTGNWQLTITVDTPCELPELQLVGKPGGFPLSLADGQPVATVPACTVTPAKSVQVAFPPPGLAAGNLRLFPSDPTDTEWLELLAQK